jgi:hypothetical protein
MDRRRFLAVAVSGVGGVGGCLAGSQVECNEENWSPTVEVDEPGLTPGETGMLTIEATPIKAFSFRGTLYTCGTDQPVEIGSVEASPDPDRYGDSCPPIFVWDDCVSATIEAPVHTTTSAEPADYTYGFSVSLRSSDNSSSHEGTINVSEE